MSRQLLIDLIAIALVAVAVIVIVRQVQQIENLQARVTTLEDRTADFGKPKRFPADLGK